MLGFKRTFKTYSRLIFTSLVLQLFLFAFVNTNRNILTKWFVKSRHEQSLAYFNFTPTHHTLVFLHIQKTSGTTFDLDLVKNMQVTYQVQDGEEIVTRDACVTKRVIVRDKNPLRNKIVEANVCKKEDERDNSLILSWHTTFGWSCGLHPGLSDLRQCVVLNRSYPNSDLSTQNEDFLFVTMLREPLMRFLSEWRHVRSSGSTWLYENKPLSKEQICLKSQYFIFIKLKNEFCMTVF
jgi:hypothetical protein